MTDQQKQEFLAKSRDLVRWLCDNGNPHMSIIITPTSAELVEGTIGLQTDEFLND